MKSTSLALFASTALCAIPPPETCDPGAIQDCLARFEEKYAECAEDDHYCQCTKITQTGASCYAACPQEAMTKFIKTYAGGQCANFDPFLSRRGAEGANETSETPAEFADETTEVLIPKSSQTTASDVQSSVTVEDTSTTEQLNNSTSIAKVSNSTITELTSSVAPEPSTVAAIVNETRKSYAATPDLNSNKTLSTQLIASQRVRAITVTPRDPSVTISLNPQEYQSRLERSRYKANLRSIRSERRRIAEEAILRTRATNQKALPEKTASTSATEKSEVKFRGVEKKKVDSSGAMPLRISLGIALGVAVIASFFI